jgi:zinc transporter, ZIP family
MSMFEYGVLESLLAGCATGIGALPVLLFTSVSRDVLNTLLGASAGVMLAAMSFSVIIPGIENGEILWPGYGVMIGFVIMMALDNLLGCNLLGRKQFKTI